MGAGREVSMKTDEAMTINLNRESSHSRAITMLRK